MRRVGGADVFKFDSSGNQITTGGWPYDTGAGTLDVTIDGNDDVFVAGVSVIKLNSAGVLQWSFNTGDTTFGIDIDATFAYIAGNRVGA